MTIHDTHLLGPGDSSGLTGTYDTPEEIRARFDAVGEDYPRLVTDTVVNYEEAMARVATRVQHVGKSVTLLEVGCGPGEFTRAVAEVVDVHATLLDFAPNMLRMAVDRLAGLPSVKTLCTECADFREFHYPTTAFDVVISSLALHHLRPGEKLPVYRRLFRSLRPGGLLLNFDEYREPDDDWEDISRAAWAGFMRSLGWSEDSLEALFAELDGEDSPDTVADEMRYLDEAGFTDVGLVLKQHLFGLVVGRRPAEVQELG